MTAITKERVEELRGYIDGCSPGALMLGKQDEANLLAILSDYSSMRAENERLTKDLDEWAKVAHDFSIELAKLKGDKK
jgi:hypothetical protein